MLTLAQWNAKQARPRCAETVRRWVRAGKIQPPPSFDGYEYLFYEDSVKVDVREPHKSNVSNLSVRIRNGQNKKHQKSRPPA